MRETVLIVHGTFSAPIRGKPTWYEPGSDFCRQLDAELAARGSSARCWAHLDECGEELRKLANRDTAYFSWNGANSWLDRSDAARQLRAEISLLGDRDWQWHIVAHSHGGNVALEAFDLDNARGSLTGNVVLLGTPILSYSQQKGSFDYGLEGAVTPFNLLRRAPLPGRDANMLRILTGVAVSFALWALLGAGGVGSLHHAQSALLLGGWIFWLISSAAILLLGLGYWALRFVGTAAAEVFTGMPRFSYDAGIYISAPRTLFIGSEKDEAYQFLSSVLKTKNPWPDPLFTKAAFASWFHATRQHAIELDGIRYPWGSWRLALWVTLILAMTSLPLRWLSAGSEAPWLVKMIVTSALLIVGLVVMAKPGAMLCAFAAPWRVLEGIFLMLRETSARMAVRYARRNAWKTLQALALGLSGSPHQLSDISVAQRPKPDFGGGAFLYEPLAEAAETVALAERARFGHDVWSRVTQLDDAQLWNIEHWPETIGIIASDPRLIHTIYYRHPDVIAQIASHLVRSSDDLLEQRKKK